MRIAPALVLVWLCVLLACPHDMALAGATRMAEREPGPGSASSARRESHTPQGPKQDTSGTARVHYAFAKHREAAELRRGSTELFDFGVPGDAKYTLAGWLTFAGAARDLDGRSAMLVRGRGVRLSLPADRGDSAWLTLELRSFSNASLAVFLNGKKLAEHKLQGKQFESVRMALAAGVLRVGENALELRVSQAGAGENRGFALDFITLSPETASAPEPRPPTPDELSVTGKPELLRVPAGIRLGYALEVPKTGEFQARVRSAGKAQLSLRAVRDHAADVVLAALDLDSTAKTLSVELDSSSHDVVRLELAAEGDAVLLENPAVVTRVSVQPQAARKPIRNVLLYLIDTLRADKLSPYNAKTRVRTPGLTRLLESASVMQHARSQENWTKPSVATLLSSLFPWQHNTFSDEAVLPESVELLPELLQKRGFFTGAFIANGYVSDKFGFKQGWQTYRNYIREGRRSVAQAVAGDVLEWFDARPQDKPFFLYVHTIDPHVPYRPPNDFLRMYDAAPYAGPVNFGGDAELLEKIKMGRIPLGARDKERLVALYDGEISYHDVHFDSILRGLDKRGLAEDTLVVVTADHGEEFWDHGSVGHGHSVFDELLHVPMIVRLPGVTPGVQISADVGLVDVAPTILEAIGETPPASMSGRSFLPELRGDSADAPRVSVSGFMTGWRTLAVGSWKLVQRALDKTFLYDTASDSGETRDLASERPITVRYLRGALGLSLAQSNPRSVARPAHAAEKTAIDAATEQQLRSLGYVGSARH
jgi:choline-sulfatase